MECDGLKTAIREMAGRHGFDLCRVARPEVSAKHAEALKRWVDADMQGDMAWMGEETRMQRRMTPESMLNDVKSVISVAMSYTPPAYTLDEACAEKDKAVITAYAHGDDYHDVMKKRLKAMARELDELLGRHDQRVFNDTAPVLEHALAEAAGLGWQGKHSLTIHRELGSWFLLAEIFTTAEIEPDEAAENHCGTCTACIDICPTRAIVAPYVVDARLCISYLTIEYSGFIPRELRRLMGNRIYGCDDCQLVCPWNDHAAGLKAEINDLLKPRGENHLPDLARLLRFDDAAFRQYFRKSPVKRTKRSGLLRNVCIAMGNSGHTAFIPDLIAVLGDQEALVRGHATWALAQLAEADHQADILSVLMAAKEAEVDDGVLEEMDININYIRNKYDNT